MEPILRTEHLTFTYPGEERPTLGDLSLEIARGSFVAVLGHNGSGKSTLAKHFNAILLPTGGKVYVDGMDTSDENNLLSVRATVGMVFQNPDNQIVANVVEDDVAFAPENLGVPPQEIRARVDAALKQVGMYDFRLHAPHLLSGGQKQRVAIAGVIAMQPKCIVLDEPTAMLDPAGRREVIDTATKLCREQGITVVLITPYGRVHRRGPRQRALERRRRCRRCAEAGLLAGRAAETGGPHRARHRPAAARAARARHGRAARRAHGVRLCGRRRCRAETVTTDLHR